MGRRAGEGNNQARNEARRRLAENPFYVLGLRPDCARAEVEREGQKLLSMLELGLSAAKRYRSPIGEHERSSTQIREAMAELRDPDRRLLHELWAGLEPEREPTADSDQAEAPTDGDASSPRTAAEAGDDTDLSPFPALAALGFE